MLKRIKIKGLFNRFNYDIELKEEGLTILTGPNGYGKTTILKIIYAFAIENIAFFVQLPFSEIVLLTEKEGSEIKLSKKESNIKVQLGNKELASYKKNEVIKKFVHFLEDSSPYIQVGENRWVDRRTDMFYMTENLFNQFIENNPKILTEYRHDKKVPEFVNVYLIKEQRLIRKKIANNRRKSHQYYFEEMMESSSDTIEEYAKELSEDIKDTLAQSSIIGQELDSSFPKRLFDEKNEVTGQAFNERYNVIKEKQKSLSLYGLSTINEDNHPSFRQENAKALLVYLNDIEKKLNIFDDLLEKLEIFSIILNKKQFAFKQLKISPDFGFKFETENGKELSLTALSSGEQQEVILLYELLFKVSPDTLVLIDEPEISLHVAWQKEVLDDLLKIIKLKKITVVLATHSPQIIGDRWDLVADLWDLTRKDSE